MPLAEILGAPRGTSVGQLPGKLANGQFNSSGNALQPVGVAMGHSLDVGSTLPAIAGPRDFHVVACRRALHFSPATSSRCFSMKPKRAACVPACNARMCCRRISAGISMSTRCRSESLFRTVRNRAPCVSGGSRAPWLAAACAPESRIFHALPQVRKSCASPVGGRLSSTQTPGGRRDCTAASEGTSTAVLARNFADRLKAGSPVRSGYHCSCLIMPRNCTPWRKQRGGRLPI